MIIKFLLLRMARDKIAHLVFTLFPMVLITIFSMIWGDATADTRGEIVAFFTIGYVLMFHYFGATFSVEYLQLDLISPLKDRLMVSPTNPATFPLQIVLMSSLVTFIQSTLILTFALAVLGATIPNLVLTLPIFLLSIIIAQLIGSVIILWVKNGSTAMGITIMIGIFMPFIAGFNIDFPPHPVLDFLRNYATPMSLSQMSINAARASEWSQYFFGFGILTLLMIALFFIVHKMVRRVIA